MYDAGKGDLGAALTRILLRAPWPVSESPLLRDGMSRGTRAKAIMVCGQRPTIKPQNAQERRKTIMCCTWAGARVKRRGGSV